MDPLPPDFRHQNGHFCVCVPLPWPMTSGNRCFSNCISKTSFSLSIFPKWSDQYFVDSDTLKNSVDILSTFKKIFRTVLIDINILKNGLIVIDKR